MAKIQWVALPLLIAAALLVVAMLRGRPWSRRTVNIGSSVLLLGYVATTAGLGIFWVANQQLPVFDWHYLFGYATVLLLALHLAFNFPRVWNHLLRRERRAADPAHGGAAVPRRSVLGALGLAAVVGAAYLLGLRQRGTGLISAEPTRAAARTEAARGARATPDALELVERFHALSSHSRAGVVTRAPSTDWREAPPPFKRIAGVPRTALPSAAGGEAGEADLAALGAVLWHTSGVTETRGGLALRASPSSGGLFATELYLVVRRWPGLAAGAWHYEPQLHALARLPAGAPLTASALADPALTDAPVLAIATAVFRRTAYKYGDRAYRYVMADLGHALENLRVAARALGVDARPAAAFDEARIAAALGLDEAEEGVIAVMGLHAVGEPGRGAASLARAADATATAPGRAVGSSDTAWQPAPAPVAAPTALASTVAVHAATSLRATDSLLRSEASVAGGRSPAADAVVALPAAAPVLPAGARDWLRVIATRRSVRRYAREALPLEVLSAVLAHMATRDTAPLSAAVRIHVVAPAVAGLDPGVYHYVPAHHALERPAPAGQAAAPSPVALRQAARAAALDQDVIGDAAVVFVLGIDRAALGADPLGAARGYRHAFIEAGRVGERIYLEACARGLGTCAVGAFYDAEAATLVGVDPSAEWVVHFAALAPKA